MTQSNSGSGNGQQQDYNPEVEFERLDEDTWLEVDSEGNESIAFTQNVRESLEDDEEDDSESESND